MPRRNCSFAFAIVFAVAALLGLGPAQASASGTITISVVGMGSVTGEGIDCTQAGGDCTQFYANECEPNDNPPPPQLCFAPVKEFTASAGSNGYAFNSWEGCESVTERTCTQTVDGSETLTARFRDAQAPSVTSLTPGSGIQQGTFSIGANASDNSSVARVDFTVRGVAVGTDFSSPYSVSFNSAGIADGTATLRATAVDPAGNASITESTITIDNNAPALSITAGPDGQTFGPGTTQTWTFSASDTTLSSVQCSVAPAGDEPSFGSCSGGNGSHSVTNKPDGSYVFAVRARDGLSRDTIVEREFSIDAAGPTVSVTKGPKPKTTRKRASFSFEASEPDSTFECSLDGGPFKECFSPRKYRVSKGRHRFSVRATDSLGNEGAATLYKWRVLGEG